MAHFKVTVVLGLLSVVALSPADQVAASGLATSYSQGGLNTGYGYGHGLGSYGLATSYNQGGLNTGYGYGHGLGGYGLATSYNQGGLNTGYGYGHGLGSNGLHINHGTYGLTSGLGSHGIASGLGYGLGGGQDYYAHPRYAYKYGVTDSHTGDIKDAHEHRDGDITTGGYSLLQPDGRKRTVHYTATGHGGFNAHVSYSGHAVHPQGYQNTYLAYNKW